MTSPTELTPARITMYGAAWCGDCRRSKALLDRRGVDYEYVALEVVVDGAARAKANRWLAEAGLPAIENLRFHDLRSKAIDDAEQLHGRDPVKFGSHRDPRTSRRHYQRRTKRQTPLE